MPLNDLLLAMAMLAALVWWCLHRRARALARPLGGIRYLDSLPAHYAWRGVLWCLLPALGLLALWLVFDEPLTRLWVMEHLPPALRPESDAARDLLFAQIDHLSQGKLNADSLNALPPAVSAAAEQLSGLRTFQRQAVSAVMLMVVGLGGLWGWLQVAPARRARRQLETLLRRLFLLCALVAVVTTAAILLAVLIEAVRFFQRVPLTEFLFGLHWSPQVAMRPDQVGSSGAFGAVPVFAGTLLIAAIALLIAVPLGLMIAVYLSQYASSRLRLLARPALEVLAGVPTVVYGFFAALTVAPWLHGLGQSLGLPVAAESALAAGLVMGVMITPHVSSLADDVIGAVPRELVDGSLALGATRSETFRRVVLPTALPGIAAGVLLAASRAIGETMIVVMAAGFAANLTFNPLHTVTTVTVQMVNLLSGDQAFDSARTLAAFALGLMLFLTTLLLNALALRIVRRYRGRYE